MTQWFYLVLFVGIFKSWCSHNNILAQRRESCVRSWCFRDITAPISQSSLYNPWPIRLWWNSGTKNNISAGNSPFSKASPSGIWLILLWIEEAFVFGGNVDSVSLIILLIFPSFFLQIIKTNDRNESAHRLPEKLLEPDKEDFPHFHFEMLSALPVRWNVQLSDSYCLASETLLTKSNGLNEIFSHFRI